MIIENALYCKEIQHQKKPLIAICLNKECQAASGLCISCFPAHANHNEDLQTIDNVRQKLEEQIQTMKHNYSICEEVIQMINLIKMETTRIIQNILGIQKISNHDDITKVKLMLIYSKPSKESTSISIKASTELKKAKEILNDLKTALEFSQSNLTDGQQQEFQECLKQANQFYVQGKFEQARQQFNYCIYLDPTNLYSKWRIGMCLKMQGVYDQANEIFDKILQDNPTFVDALCHKADSLRLQGKYQEALDYFDKTLSLDEKNFVGLSYKGETLRKMQRYADSLIFFDRALIINPKNAITLFGKGDSLRCLKRYDESLITLNQGEQIDPNNALIQYSKGYCLKAKGQVQEAIECFKKCIAINPQYKNSVEKELEQLKN
ncbi:unnamed protein product (macronuclear) [Paramecium tetraurelia]|uniref:Uncharacterized protein n=1 Tax=Paramecium tetraurelia TaxID=5888 RepID=A0DZB7_PARTE|nr:uncharacterized protein GSPATT00003353001 [Paramecium tetraurelia]CAK88384.1 unnamed protein product [Paramecium tetraurelia]|eukprot:XP_001455781.1 hypothetical protein (macronuclear) [Paramecium tetraurelia strain d4-2]